MHVEAVFMTRCLVVECDGDVKMKEEQEKVLGLCAKI